MQLFKTECPVCNHRIEGGEEMANGVKCPSCQTGFVPAKLRSVLAEEKIIASAPPGLRDRLHALRAHTAYPEIRDAIDMINIIGTVLLCCNLIGWLIYLAAQTSMESILLVLISGGIFVAWMALYKPLASLLVDIADACIDSSRRQ
jgi:hypothetical protein